MTTSHHSTVEISSVVLHLRRDLAICVREFGGQPIYVIEDEINSRFFRIGLSEYTFLSVLDGHTTFADALGQTASVMKEDALPESEAAAFCRWLIENRLASTPQSESSARLFEANEQVRRRKQKGLLNPMFVKIPLMNPDSLLKPAAAIVGWFFAWPMLIVWLLVLSVGVLSVAMNWSEAVTGSSMIIDDGNWIWLLATWVLLKLVHECAHGIACRRFGGSVREAGALLLLFIPLPYVDVTSAWRFDSKWQRIIVSAAGMYAELFVAAIAAIVWGNTEVGLLHQHAFNVMLSGSLMTVLFNANPLMRFDGYYILTDLLELPNLAAHGQQSLMRIGRRIFFGLSTSEQNWPEGHATTILLYGVLAFVWRVLICVGLVLAADALYFGAGIVLAAIAVVLWVLLPMWKLVRFVIAGSKTERPNRRQFAAVAGSLFVAGFAICNYIPWYSRFEAPAVVDFKTVVDVRTGVSGFVESVNVSCGQQVEKGDVLITLRNPELATRRFELVRHLEKTQQQARQFFDQEQIAAWQVSQGNEASLQTQLYELDDQQAQLVVRAPASGRVLDSRLAELSGTWLQRGAPMLTIGDENSKHVAALIAPESADAFTRHLDQDLTVHVYGTGVRSFTGRLRSLSPRASVEIIHPAFAATAGGPLSVVANNESGGDAQHLQFVQPQLRAEVVAPSQSLQNVRPGRSAIVSFRTSPGTIGQVIGTASQRWIHGHQAALLDRGWH